MNQYQMVLGPILKLLSFDIVYSQNIYWYLVLFIALSALILFSNTCHNHYYAMNNYTAIRVRYPDSKNLKIDIESISSWYIIVGSISIGYRTDINCYYAKLFTAGQKFQRLFICERNALVIIFSMFKSSLNTCSNHCFVMNNCCAIQMRVRLRKWLSH